MAHDLGKLVGAAEKALGAGAPGAEAQAAARRRVREAGVTAGDGLVEGDRLLQRLDPEDVGQHRLAASEGVESVVLAPELVGGGHRQPVRSFGKVIDGQGPVGETERDLRLARSQRGFGAGHADVHEAGLVALPDGPGPLRVRLVLQDFAPEQIEGGRQQLPRLRGPGPVRLGDERVEVVEVDRGVPRNEAIPTRLGADDRLTDLGARLQPAAQDGDVALERAEVVGRELLPPEEVGQAVLGDRVAPVEQKDLEDLLRLDPAQLPGPEVALSVLHADLSEHRKGERALLSFSLVLLVGPGLFIHGDSLALRWG